MHHLLALMAGVLLGAASCALGFWLTGKFDPFDSSAGFWTTQIVLGGAALFVALNAGAGRLALLILGGYLGLNLYFYVIGGSESRAWAMLAAITTLALLVQPVLVGLLGLMIRWVRSKSRVKKTHRESGQHKIPTTPPDNPRSNHFYCTLA